jgi:hypothetical protein
VQPHFTAVHKGQLHERVQPRPQPNMNIAALVNPANEPPRRSSSNAHSVTAASPAISAAKLPTPPLSTPKPKRPMHTRRRHDPKPIWAVLEHEVVVGQPQKQLEQHQQSRPPPPPAAPRPAPPVQAPAHDSGPPHVRHPLPSSDGQLFGYRRPITDEPVVYDATTLRLCDFFFSRIIANDELRQAVAQSPGTEIEIEARWGQLSDSSTGFRLQGLHDTECVLKRDVAQGIKFDSTMTLAQHKKMNQVLNEQVSRSKAEPSRTDVDYKHTKELDTFYELDQNGFNLLDPAMRQIVATSPKRLRIRVTRDARDGRIIRKIIKHRIENLEISSPSTLWDYRIGINLEIEYPGPVEGMQPVIENGRSLESMERKKDRLSYSWLSAYQIDLTQVIQGQNKNHELELELDAGLLIEAGDNLKRGLPNDYEALVAGMMNNLRVLSRIFPMGSGN